MIDSTKKKICEQIVNVFETGRAEGNYGDVTVIGGDSGGLSYGRSQVTLGSGNLYGLLKEFVERVEAMPGGVKGHPLAALLEAHLPRFRQRDESLNSDKNIHMILRKLGEDSLMRVTQDDYFDEMYWHPAERMCEQLGLELPLSHAVVYDSFIHGGFGIVRKKFPEVPPSRGGDEKKWVVAYLEARRNWLLNNIGRDGNPYKADDFTIYRVDTFKHLVVVNNWNLDPPIIVQGVTIDA